MTEVTYESVPLRFYFFPLNVFSRSVTYFHNGFHKTTYNSKLSCQPSQELHTFNPNYYWFFLKEIHIVLPLTFPPFQKPIGIPLKE